MRTSLLFAATVIAACATPTLDPLPESSLVYLCGDVEAMLGARGADVRLFLPQGEVALAPFVSDRALRGDLNGERVLFARDDLGATAKLQVGPVDYPTCERIT